MLIFNREQPGMTVHDVCLYLNIHISTAHALVQRGRLTKLPKSEWPNGRCSLFDKKSVVKYRMTRRYNRRYHEITSEAIAAVLEQEREILGEDDSSDFLTEKEMELIRGQRY